MWYPQNPKVLVVDDCFDEVKPLLSLFSQTGIPYLYFDGGIDSVPERPFTSVRLVVLDIDLKDRTNGQNEKGKASALAGYLDQLITLQDSPYAILFWTKHEEIINEIISYLNDANCSPVTYINMEKPLPKEINLDYVRTHFFSNLDNDSFEFLINWENSINQNISSFTNELSNIVKQESESSKQEWDESMKTILTKMACTYTGKENINDATMDQANSYAVSLLNQSFSESMPTSLQPSLSLPAQSKVTLQVVANLNKILFVEKSKDDQIETGKVYIEENNKQLHDLLESSIIKESCRDNCKSKLIGVVLTPNCDVAHDNVLTDSSGNKFHRILFGLKILVSENPEKYIKKKKDYLYITHPFNDEHESCSAFIFHFGTIQTIPINPSSIHFSYFMKNSLVFDLQSKLANHVNRLGNSMLEC